MVRDGQASEVGMVVVGGIEVEGATALVVLILGVEGAVGVSDARRVSPPAHEARHIVTTSNAVVTALREPATATSPPVLLYYAGESGSVVAQ
jgi:hypothetical protein